jgi:hypothetical protein
VCLRCQVWVSNYVGFYKIRSIQIKIGETKDEEEQKDDAPHVGERHWGCLSTLSVLISLLIYRRTTRNETIHLSAKDSQQEEMKREREVICACVRCSPGLDVLGEDLAVEELVGEVAQ